MATEPEDRSIYEIAESCMSKFKRCSTLCICSFGNNKWAAELASLFQRRARLFEDFCDLMKISKVQYEESLDYELRNDNGTKEEAIGMLDKIGTQLQIVYDTTKDAVIIEMARPHSAAKDEAAAGTATESLSDIRQQDDNRPSYELNRGFMSDRRTLIEPKFRNLLDVILKLHKGFVKNHFEIIMHEDYIKGKKRIQERMDSAIGKQANDRRDEPAHAQQYQKLYICFFSLCDDESKHVFTDVNEWIHHTRDDHRRQFKCSHGDKPTDHKLLPVYMTVDVPSDVTSLLNPSVTNPSPADDIGHMVLSGPSSNAAAPTGPSKKVVLAPPLFIELRCPLCGITDVDCVYKHIIDKHFPTPLSPGFNNPSGIAQQEVALDELCTQLERFSF